MSKATADRNQRQLVALLKEPGNDQCADCKARNPRWAAWDHGVFLCVQCASMHRKLGSHISKVKSVTLDTWSRDQVDNMRRLGNSTVNLALNPDERRHPPPPPDSGDERNSELERFIRNKYEYRTFAAPAPPPQAPTVNGHANGSSHSPANTTPRRTPTPSSSHAEPPNDPPPPPLPSRPQQLVAAPAPPARAVSAFDDFSSTFSEVAPPTLPPRPPLVHIPASAPPVISGPKSVRIADLPPTVIPSPSDAEDDDDDLPLSARQPRQRTRARSASVLPPRKGALRHRPGAAPDIPVDWAAFTRDSALEPDGDDDVPLGTLGALGARGAQVGMVGVPQAQGAWAVPYGQPGAAVGAGAPAYGGSQSGPAIAPLLPQYTGSAKGYLHQQLAAAPQQPQATGIDAFQQMFQPRPPAQQQVPASSPNPFQQAFAQPSPQPQQTFPQAHHQQQPAFAQPQPRTNPFHSHLFARNAYSPSPQPPTPSPQPAPSPASNDVWGDLDLLSRPPRPAFFGGSGGTPSPSLFTAPTPSPTLTQQQPHAPAPLRHQLTGFVPSSSFGQQLARETGGGGSMLGAGLTLQIPGSSSAPGSAVSTPRGSAPASPAPFSAPAPSPGRLEPQRTGFVPSSAFGQELLRTQGGAAGGAFFPPARSPASAAVEPAPFDLPTPSPAPQQQANPFATLGASLGGALPQQPPPAPNPFLLQPQVTGFGAGGGGAPPFVRPQVTGFGGGGVGAVTAGGGNPFLAFQQQQPQQQQDGGVWR
ncbi:hypothetical protein JCM3770_003194 [Rhodotorula araucariae]